MTPGGAWPGAGSTGVGKGVPVTFTPSTMHCGSTWKHCSGGGAATWTIRGLRSLLRPVTGMATVISAPTLPQSLWAHRTATGCVPRKPEGWASRTHPGQTAPRSEGPDPRQWSSWSTVMCAREASWRDQLSPPWTYRTSARRPPPHRSSRRGLRSPAGLPGKVRRSRATTQPLRHQAIALTSASSRRQRSLTVLCVPSQTQKQDRRKQSRLLGRMCEVTQRE